MSQLSNCKEFWGVATRKCVERQRVPLIIPPCSVSRSFSVSSMCTTRFSNGSSPCRSPPRSRTPQRPVFSERATPAALHCPQDQFVRNEQLGLLANILRYFSSSPANDPISLGCRRLSLGRKQIDHMDDDSRAFDVPQELVAQAIPSCAPSINPARRHGELAVMAIIARCQGLAPGGNG